ncbi:MAG: aminopeptidase, partial [Bacteroidetes bacterium]|nr:aminopeptidase [Bacteroidota bacterium]
MKKLFVAISCMMVFFVGAQDINKIVNAKEVERIEKTLSADDMQGRRTFTPGIEKAAAFISEEFKNTGLQTWKNSNTYLQEFALVKPKFISLTASINDQVI